MIGTSVTVVSVSAIGIFESTSGFFADSTFGVNVSVAWSRGVGKIDVKTKVLSKKILPNERSRPLVCGLQNLVSEAFMIVVLSVKIMLSAPA